MLPAALSPKHFESPEVCFDLHSKSNISTVSKTTVIEYIERNYAQTLSIIYTDGYKTPVDNTGAACELVAICISKTIQNFIYMYSL